MRRLCILTRQLAGGGAERQILELVRGIDRSAVDVIVLTLYSGGVFENEVRDLLGANLVCIDKRHRWDLLGFIVRYARRIRSLRPDTIYSFLGLPNVLAAAATHLVPKTRIVWGIRASDVRLSLYGWTENFLFKAQRLLAPCADLLIANSHAGKAHYIANNFPAGKFIVIPNGIDTQRFQPDPSRRRAVRAEWGIDCSEILVGIVARIDPMKDHRTFLKAVSIARERVPRMRVAIIGTGDPRACAELKEHAKNLDLECITVWPGLRPDMPAVYNALDVLCSSSAFGEGFSNVIGEALASGTRVAVTDVGDAAFIVGSTAPVVPPGDPEALAGAIVALAASVDGTPFLPGRERIVEQFSVAAMVRKTEEALWPTV